MWYFLKAGASHLPEYDEETNYEDAQIEEEELFPSIIGESSNYFTKENDNFSIPCAVENLGTFFIFFQKRFKDMKYMTINSSLNMYFYNISGEYQITWTKRNLGSDLEKENIVSILAIGETVITPDSRIRVKNNDEYSDGFKGSALFIDSFKETDEGYYECKITVGGENEGDGRKKLAVESSVRLQRNDRTYFKEIRTISHQN